MNDFVERMMRDGVPDEDIEAALISAGWSASAARSRVRAWHRSPLGPVPRPSVRASEASHGLIALTLLAMICWQAAELSFSLIRMWVPDAAELASGGGYWGFGTAWPAANLLVLCPLFAWLRRRFGPPPDWARIAARAVAFAVLTGDAIAALHGLLSGGAGLRFALSCAAVAVLALLAKRAMGADRA